MHYHSSAVNMIRFNVDGTIFASCGNDKKVNVFNAINFQRIGSITCQESLKAFVITKDSEYLITGGFVGSIEVFRIQDGKQMGISTWDLKVRTIEVNYSNDYI